jgi:hypothetical protein
MASRSATQKMAGLPRRASETAGRKHPARRPIIGTPNWRKRMKSWSGGKYQLEGRLIVVCQATQPFFTIISFNVAYRLTLIDQQLF